MDKEVVRLECLKLASVNCRDHAEAMNRAKEYVEFVLEQKPSTDSPKENQKGRKSKQP